MSDAQAQLLDAWRTSCESGEHLLMLSHAAAKWLCENIDQLDTLDAHQPLQYLSLRTKRNAGYLTEFSGALSDGVLLCEVVRLVEPGLLKKTHGSVGVPIRDAAWKRANLTQLLGALKYLNVKSGFQVSAVLACNAALELLHVLIALQPLLATRGVARWSVNVNKWKKKKKRFGKAEVAHAQAVCDKFDARSVLTASGALRPASAVCSSKEQLRMARMAAEKVRGDAAALRKLVLVQAVVRGRLARRRVAALRRARAYRLQAARELLDTERAYCASLDALEVHYRGELAKLDKPLLSGEEMQLLFGGVFELAVVSRAFVERLQRRVTNWRPATCVGDTFFKLTGSLKLYSLYVKQFADADALLKRKLKESKAFGKFLERARASSGRQLDLPSLLIMPVQRIPRYELLLRELAEHTEPTHADAAHVARARREIGEVARFVNSRQRDAEQELKLREVQCAIVARPRDFVQPHRHWIDECEVQFGAKRDVRRMCLMSDLLLITRPLSRLERLKVSKGELHKYVASLSLDTVTLTLKDARSLALSGTSRFDADESAAHSLALTFRDEKLLAKWMQLLDEATRAASTAMLPPFPPLIMSESERKAMRKKFKSSGSFEITPPIFNEKATVSTRRDFGRTAEATAGALTEARKIEATVANNDSDDSSDDDAVGTAIFDPSKIANQRPVRLSSSPVRQRRAARKPAFVRTVSGLAVANEVPSDSSSDDDEAGAADSSSNDNNALDGGGGGGAGDGLSRSSSSNRRKSGNKRREQRTQSARSSPAASRRTGGRKGRKGSRLGALTTSSRRASMPTNQRERSGSAASKSKKSNSFCEGAEKEQEQLQQEEEMDFLGGHYDDGVTPCVVSDDEGTEGRKTPTILSVEMLSEDDD